MKRSFLQLLLCLVVLSPAANSTTPVHETTNILKAYSSINGTTAPGAAATPAVAAKKRSWFKRWQENIILKKVKKLASAKTEDISKGKRVLVAYPPLAAYLFLQRLKKIEGGPHP